MKLKLLIKPDFSEKINDRQNEIPLSRMVRYTLYQQIFFAENR